MAWRKLPNSWRWYSDTDGDQIAKVIRRQDGSVTWFMMPGSEWGPVCLADTMEQAQSYCEQCHTQDVLYLADSKFLPSMMDSQLEKWIDHHER